MKNRFPSIIFVLLVVYIVISACAQTKFYTPRPATAKYYLDGLPANVVNVIVNDLRLNSDNNELASVLKMQLLAALYPQPSNQSTNRYVLTIDIIDHRSFFSLGNWNASTHFHIRLTDSMGKMLGQWEAKGSAQLSNMWSFDTAKEVAQNSYEIAISDMMSSLSQVTVR
jgi:hypothetical protein